MGCGINVDVASDGLMTRSDDAPENASSQGMLCVKGRFGFEFVNHKDRLTRPFIRRNGMFEEATWDEALDLVADKFVEYRGAFGALARPRARMKTAM